MENRVRTENIRRNRVPTKYVHEKMILQAPSLDIYVICTYYRM